MAAALLRGDRGRLSARSAARGARSALPRGAAGGGAGRVPPGLGGGAAWGGGGGGRRSPGPVDRARRTLGRDARLHGARGEPVPTRAGGDVRCVLTVTHARGAALERRTDSRGPMSESDRALQDSVIRALADAPYRASPEWRGLALADPTRLERFARFLARHFYFERVVHFFKYSRALARVTGRRPEAVLHSPGFDALLSTAVLGSRATARAVAALAVRHLRPAGAARSIPYLDDLLAYEEAVMVAEAGARAWRVAWKGAGG